MDTIKPITEVAKDQPAGKETDLLIWLMMGGSWAHHIDEPIPGYQSTGWWEIIFPSGNRQNFGYMSRKQFYHTLLCHIPHYSTDMYYLDDLIDSQPNWRCKKMPFQGGSIYWATFHTSQPLERSAPDMPLATARAWLAKQTWDYRLANGIPMYPPREDRYSCWICGGYHLPETCDAPHAGLRLGPHID